MEKRVYDNEKLEKMLNRYIKKEKYGGFKPLLNEIFLRRAYEFGFDDRQMKEQIKNFVKRVERIGFGKNIPRLGDGTSAVRRTFQQKSYIWFNCESVVFDVKDDYIATIDWLLDIYEILTHEVYHGISEHEYGTGLRSSITGNGEVANEIVTETAACRTSYLRSETEDKNFRQETLAYCEMTYISNLLPSSFGIGEREFLKGGLQNWKKLQNALKKYISNEDYQNDILFHFDILKTNLDLLYNVLYGEEENSNDLEIMISSTKEICCQIYDIANVRVSKSTREINLEYAEELAYEFQKIRKIMGNNIEWLVRYGMVKREVATQIIEEIYSSEGSLGYLNKVSDILVLTEQKSRIKDQPTLEKMEQLAKEGQLINHAEEFGIEVGKNLTSRYKVIEYHKKTNHEFDNPTQWDNDYVTKIMEQLWNEREVVDVAKLEEELIIANNKTKSEKIKNFFVQFKNRKLKRLESSAPNYKNLDNHLDERYKVSPENLKPMETGKNESNHAPNQERE